ncbi:MAG: PAS domain-containing protein [Anaerotruncus massiliensis (ex Togo et al. 2019)]
MRDPLLIQYSEGFPMFTYGEDLQTRFHNNFAGMIYEKDLRGVWETALRQLAKSNTKEIEYRVRCKDGRLVWVLDRGQLVEDERGRKWFYCILIDITRTKKAQEELRLSLERHQIIMDQTTDIIFEWDISRDYLTAQSTKNYTTR